MENRRYSVKIDLMKKFRSPINDREYCILEGTDQIVPGVPCFTLKDIEVMKGRKYTKSELNLIFDAKLELGIAVEPEEKDCPRKELGYIFPRDKIKKLEEKETIYNHLERGKIAKEWASRIKDTIASTSLKGIKTS